jgi:hypothetical protein
MTPTGNNRLVAAEIADVLKVADALSTANILGI